MRSGQREIGSVVVKSILRISCGVTGQASRILINIPVHAIVFIVGFRVYMTSCAGKFRKIGGVGMAISTQRPLSLVFPAINREKLGIMLGVLRWHPVQIGGMANRAIVREIGLNVVGGSCAFKIGLVTGKTVGWRV